MENEAEALIGSKEYSLSRPKKIPKSRMLDESSSSGVEFSEKKQFLQQFHYVICDSLITELKKWKCAHDALKSIFGFMTNDNLSAMQVIEYAKKIHEIYSTDIEEKFPDEFLQIKVFILKDLKPTEKLKLLSL